MAIEKEKRLSDETRRRLERALWQERLRQIGLALGISLPILAVVVFSVVFRGFDAIEATYPVAGIVEETRAAEPARGIISGRVKVRLDKGGEVTVNGFDRPLPAVGARITLTERRHKFQVVDWVWE